MLLGCDITEEIKEMQLAGYGCELNESYTSSPYLVLKAHDKYRYCRIYKVERDDGRRVWLLTLRDYNRSPTDPEDRHYRLFHDAWVALKRWLLRGEYDAVGGIQR